jgi:hypothetical protein
MTTLREAVVLPLLFLTVAGLGGLRIGHPVALVPPPLVSLVLAVMLMAALVRAGVFAPAVLMNATRSALENISGLVVLLTLFAASAQVFTLVTPERGLLHVVFSICLFVQLASTVAGVKGRVNLLRSLVVLLGAAFVVRFIVLESLYAPDGGMAKRLLTTIVEGASLGTIQYSPTGAATGYVAFLTLVLFVVGLILLPPMPPRGRLSVRALRPPTSAAVVILIAVVAASSACTGSEETLAKAAENGSTDAGSADRMREEALAAARVWSPPAVPIAQFDFTSNPPLGFSPSDEVSCRFTVDKPSGRTPKFHCQLPDGREIKVKYGKYNAELQAELAGTRLLRALGFPADEMFTMRAVHCAGCPAFPFQSLTCRQRLGADLLCFGGPLDYSHVRTFVPVVVERRVDARIIESFDGQGWSWYELDRIDPARGGSSRAEVDALRLLAVFLAHWDNKAANQRLICPSGRESSGGGCAAPVAMIQDLGATFGPNRIDLLNWRAAPVWQDRATCTVSMHSLPYAGATFPEHRISDAGRLMLAGLLEQLSTRQLEDLFTASGILLYDAIDADARTASGWIKVFRDKTKAIREGPPCPQ